MVGNGYRLQCSDSAPKVPITLQNHLLFIPFYLLPIEGVDMVLGMECLRTLEPLSINLSIPKISFNHNQINITIIGNSHHTPTPLTYKALYHILHIHSIASM